MGRGARSAFDDGFGIADTRRTICPRPAMALAEVDNAPSATTCGAVSIYAPQQTHAFPMPHLSWTRNNPHPLSRARAAANRALHPL